MKTYEIKEQGATLKKAIMEGKIFPVDVVDAVVWAQDRKLEIRLNEAVSNYEKLKEAVVFFWDYTGEKPFVIREIEVRDNCITLEQDKTLMLQMQLLQVDSVRVVVAFRFENTCFCCYIRNNEAKNEELQPIERSICKLAESDTMAFVAYWTEGGILSVKNRDRQKFDNEFYQARLSEYYWENGNLTAYLETPLMAGEARMEMLSASTNVHCANASTTLENVADSGLKRIWKLTVDLSALSADDSDGYRLLCTLGGHSFRIYFDGETDDDALCKITLKSGETLDVCVVKEKTGRLILKTGKIYPVMLSVVTAVYNTAPFLAEMINSVLSQDVSQLEKLREDYRSDYYQDIFEFILVDDGSTDGSSDILDDYAQISDRIKVIHKGNGGVSSARNAGINIARGKYINFADSDDMLSENFMDETLRFFEMHEEDICFVTTPMIFFDAAVGEHWTNYKFINENRIVNMADEPDAISVFTCSSVYKLDRIGNLRFNTAVPNGEDVLFNYTLLMNTLSQVGAVSECQYMYRRRSEGEESAIQASQSTPYAYLFYLENVLEPLLLNAKSKYGTIPKYVQCNVMGQLQWKFAVTDKGEQAIKVLGESDFQSYKKKAFELVKYIDDDVILGQKKIWNEVKYFILKKKYQESPSISFADQKNFFCIHNNTITTPFEKTYIRLEFMEFKGNTLHLEGYSMNYEPDIELLIYVNGVSAAYKEQKRAVDKYCFDEICFYAKTFVMDIELDENEEIHTISFANKYKNVEVKKEVFRYAGATIPLAMTYSKSYYASGNWVLRKENSNFVIRNIMKSDCFIDFEEEFKEEVRKKKRTANLEYMLKIRSLVKHKLACKSEKKIWLLSDRVNIAGDNGEAMFTFLANKKDNAVEAYFLLNKDSDDYQRMQEVGTVIPRDTEIHHLLQLTADYLVSSSGEHFVFNPWCEDRESSEIVRDLLAHPKFIFLQHGVIKDDLSGWLNRYNKNITGFICTAPREAQSILDYNYYYKAENVWLTGLPRHDRLYRNEKRKIVIMPTWRQYLALKSGDTNELVQDFNQSEYFVFYNELINNNKLLEAAEKYNYKICFMPHPRIKMNGLRFFKKDKRVEFLGFDTAYKDVYAEADLCVTDYSSSVMDFAILRKPIVYCQFDNETFLANHTYTKGYYDYEEDGFGEVTYDMDSLIDVMIGYMKDDCKVHEPYGSRMDKFFAFHDQNNCERVYRKIKELG